MATASTRNVHETEGRIYFHAWCRHIRSAYCNIMILIATNVACTRIIRIKVIARFRSILREIIYWALITTIVMRSWITASINRGAGRECTLVTVAFRRHVIRIMPIICRQVPIIITGSTRGPFRNPIIRMTYIHRAEIQLMFVQIVTMVTAFQVHYPINCFTNGVAFPTVSNSHQLMNTFEITAFNISFNAIFFSFSRRKWVRLYS